MHKHVNTPSPRLTPAGRQVLALAREEAERWNHSVVFTQHLLLGCIRLGKGQAARVLQNHGLELEAVRLEFSRLVEVGPDREPTAHIPLGPKIIEVLASAANEAKELGRAYIGAEHILMALLRQTDGVVARVLITMKVDIEKLNQELLDGFEPRSGAQRG